MTRAEQKEMRKKEILIKSIELFTTKGYKETKITDIAKNVKMSVGLLFHYFDSKEDLYYELVKMGVEETKKIEVLKELPPEKYFDEILNQLFMFSKKEPWVFQMFILMNQARKSSVPKEIREIANSINQIEISSKIIEKGQKEGIFKEGNPKLLATCFWASVQGIMEQMAEDKSIEIPNIDWITSIIKK